MAKYKNSDPLYMFIAFNYLFDSYISNIGSMISENNKALLMYLFFFEIDDSHTRERLIRVNALQRCLKNNCVYYGLNYAEKKMVSEDKRFEGTFFQHLQTYFEQMKIIAIDKNEKNTCFTKNSQKDLTIAISLFIENYNDYDFYLLRGFMATQLEQFFDDDWKENDREFAVFGNLSSYLAKKINVFLLRYDLIPDLFSHDERPGNFLCKSREDAINCGLVFSLIYFDYSDNLLWEAADLFRYRFVQHTQLSDGCSKEEKKKIYKKDEEKAAKVLSDLLKGSDAKIIEKVLTNRSVKTGYLIDAYIEKSDSLDKKILELSRDNKKQSRLKKCLIDILWCVFFKKKLPDYNNYISGTEEFGYGSDPSVLGLIELVSSIDLP